MSDQEHTDIRQQQEMWNDFTRLAKWTLITVSATLALMAIFLT